MSDARSHRRGAMPHDQCKRRHATCPGLFRAGGIDFSPQHDFQAAHAGLPMPAVIAPRPSLENEIVSRLLDLPEAGDQAWQ